jgi:hypothetical protein
MARSPLPGGGAIDLVAQIAPDAEHQRAIGRVAAQAEHLTGTRERHFDDRFDAAGMRRHDDDAVAECHRLVDAVGDEHDRLLVFVPDAQQFLLQQGTVLLVERRERLVHQQHLGVGGESARDRDALLHAARQLVRIAVGERRQPGAVEVVTDHVADVGARRAAHLEAVGGVVPHRHPRKDRLALKHHRVERFRGVVGDDRHLAGGRGFETGEDAEEGGLAAAGRADDRAEIAAGDVEADAVQCRERTGACHEGLIEAGDPDLGRRQGKFRQGHR